MQHNGKAAEGHDLDGFSNSGKNPTPTPTQNGGPGQYQFALSLMTSATGPVSKGFALDPEGKLVKKPGGKLRQGTAKIMRFETLHDLAETIARMTPEQVLTYGVPMHDEAMVTTGSNLESARAEGGGLPVIARDREHFKFQAGPAVLMLDYDAPKDGTPGLERESVMEALYAVAPGLEAAPHTVMPSASTYIYDSRSGARLDASKGLRVLVLVADGSDIPRAGKTLFDRLLLAGHGRVELSKAGGLLVRTLVDGSVWQPERLDYVGGAACEPPLEQRRPAAIVYNTDAPPLNSRAALPSLNQVDADKAKTIVDQLKRDAEPTAKRARDSYAAARAKAVTGRDDGPEFEAARRLYLKAAQDHLLLGDFKIHLDGEGELTVGHLLDDPGKYHGRRCADPLEPDYGNDKRIGYVVLRAKGRPYIWSHAHGGQKFYLHRALETIRLAGGSRVEVVERAVELIRLGGDIFNRGGELVLVDDHGAVHPLNLHRLLYELDARARWEKFDARKSDWKPCDAPEAVARGIVDRARLCGLPELEGVVTAPYMVPGTGRIVVEDGYDPETRLLLLSAGQDFPAVPEAPTREQAKAALDALLFPFKEFPFVRDVDRGVFLAALITAVLRAVLPTAPAFLFTAPTPASGKTLLALCLSVLAGELMPGVFSGACPEEELRKRLFAIGRKGRAALVLDNINGAFSSDSLCAWLTVERYADRVLGVTEEVSVPTKTLVMLTGNNTRLKGADIIRRVLECRIDAQQEQPWTRAFQLDPLQYCRENRAKMVTAALTLLRYAHGQEHPAQDRTGSFEVWSDTVRKAVLIAGAHGLTDVADPVAAIQEAAGRDPESAKLRAVLLAWKAAFGDRAKPVKAAIEEGGYTAATKAFVDGQEDEEPLPSLRDALEEVTGPRERGNVRILGCWLDGVEGRRADGLYFTRGPRHGGRNTWRVVAE